MLNAAGIEATLADEHAYTLGQQYAPWGIRLQVAENDQAMANKVLAHGEGFTPLPEDFIPPPAEGTDLAEISERKSTATGAFFRGGLWVLAVFLVLAGISLAVGGEAHADSWGVVALFIIGGVAGIVIRAIYRKGRKDALASG